MYIYTAYKNNTQLGRSCFLPDVEDKIFSQAKLDHPSAIVSESRKSIKIKTVDGDSVTVNSFSPTNDNDIVMFMDDDAHEYYRLERDVLK